MKIRFFTFIIFSFPCFVYPQLAPQKDFTDKISFMEQQQYAAKTPKIPLIFNGDDYDLKYQRMRWSIDPDTLFISGEVTSYFKIIQPSVSSIRFDFSSTMKIDSVKFHSSVLPFLQTEKDTLIIYLPSALPLNTLDSLSVFYHGNPRQGVGFGSFIKSRHNGTPVIWTLSEPYGAKEWWPCKNDLSDKPDSVDVFVITPQQYRAASNGMLISEIQQGAYKTAHWKHRYPIAAYLVAIAVTDYQDFSVYAHYGSDSIQILNYVYPESLADAQTNVPSIIASMELYNSLFISYPFIRERYGQTQFGWGGGMEHQTMTFLNSFGHELMAHELAHQWVGDMITCGSWHDIWLNEGFATYWTGLTYEHLFNGYYWNTWKRNQVRYITRWPGGSVYCYDTTNVNRIFDGTLSYAKGGMLLHMLRWVVGDSAFYACMKNYLSDANLAYGFACSDDFIAHAETASGKDLKEFFDDWLYGEGYPVYTIRYSTSYRSDSIHLTINQAPSDSSVSFFEMPVPIRFKNTTHDTIIVFDNTFDGQQYFFDPGFRPDSAFLDPGMWIVSNHDTIIIVYDDPALQDFSVYPNPATDFISVEYEGKHLLQMELYDIRGMLVSRAIHDNNTSQGNMKIYIKDFAEGVYLLKLTCNDKIVVRKIAKQ